ncbi:ferrous iron transport protein A [Rhodovulum imhoffii]|uniref:Ferrous iron transport protein A n=2 Tax=Rhodovulum imhoffii TaxID=365340 RepID=A0A2T5BRE9_9RHOB|nr:ferrous iron transport protein A [Rhodovulum imhoffii]
MGNGEFGHKGWGMGKGGGRRRHGRGWSEGPCAACPGRSLNDTAPGTTCRISRLLGCGPIRQRLMDLGLHPSREVTVIRSAPLRDPIELQVGDTFIILRRREAAQVEVEHV